jgi:hypothetical protein
MALSAEQISELKKYQKILIQLEKINSVSNFPDQKERVSKDILKYRAKILSISPNGIPDTIQSFGRSESKSQNSDDDDMTAKKNNPQIQAVFDNLVVMRLSPHSTDQEINFLSTIINMLEVEFIPVIGDSHIKFDFSHISERNNIQKQFDSLKRTSKVLIETVEEYATTDKQEFKEQMGRMKNKQSRVFLSEASELFKNFKTFIDNTLVDLSKGENIINNTDEPIKFNPKTEHGTILSGKSIRESLEAIGAFLEIALSNISVPK